MIAILIYRITASPSKVIFLDRKFSVLYLVLNYNYEYLASSLKLYYFCLPSGSAHNEHWPGHQLTWMSFMWFT
jgi:hypothetical protein